MFGNIATVKAITNVSFNEKDVEKAISHLKHYLDSDDYTILYNELVNARLTVKLNVGVTEDGMFRINSGIVDLKSNALQMQDTDC